MTWSAQPAEFKAQIDSDLKGPRRICRLSIEDGSHKVDTAQSIESAILARARPHMLATRTKAIVREELSKGCRPEIAPHPVALEPIYQPIFDLKEVVACSNPTLWIPKTPIPAGDLVRLQIWVSPEQRCEWNRSELLLKQLSAVRYRVGLEIVGNREHVVVQILCHREDLAVVKTAFCGQFEQCVLSMVRKGAMLERFTPSSWAKASFCDFFPSPPYSHLFTQPDELKRSPYVTVLTALVEILPPAVGFYQVVFAPVSPRNNWHQNVQALLDLEYSIKLIGGITTPVRHNQQGPSGDLHRMSMDVETKAHNDKPFFAVALRIGVVDGQEQAGDLIRSLTVMGGLFQHGGRPLNCLIQDDYQQQLNPEQIGQMFAAGLTYRPGFLLNSRELTSLVHVPPPEITEHLRAIIPPLETLPPGDTLAAGILDDIEKPSTEIFPKQDKLNGSTIYGNFINAPLFGRLAPKGRTVFVNPDNGFRPYPDQWDFLESIQRVPESLLDEIIEINSLASSGNGSADSKPAPVPRNARFTFGLPPCAQTMLTEGVVEHQRVACFRLALHLKKAGLPQDIAIVALQAWAAKNRPKNDKRIITDAEIFEQTRCAYTKNYHGCGCEEAAVIPYCSPDCPLKCNTKAKSSREDRNASSTVSESRSASDQ